MIDVGFAARPSDVAKLLLLGLKGSTEFRGPARCAKQAALGPK